jgi:hypothetical protein
MATPEVERTSGELVGRERECAALYRLLEASARGESGCLVLRGEAGIGKTALLTYAGERGGGRRVLAPRVPRSGCSIPHGPALECRDDACVPPRLPQIERS